MSFATLSSAEVARLTLIRRVTLKAAAGILAALCYKALGSSLDALKQWTSVTTLGRYFRVSQLTNEVGCALWSYAVQRYASSWLPLVNSPNASYSVASLATATATSQLLFPLASRRLLFSPALTASEILQGLQIASEHTNARKLGAFAALIQVGHSLIFEGIRQAQGQSPFRLPTVVVLTAIDTFMVASSTVFSHEVLRYLPASIGGSVYKTAAVQIAVYYFLSAVLGAQFQSIMENAVQPVLDNLYGGASKIDYRDSIDGTPSVLPLEAYREYETMDIHTLGFLGEGFLQCVFDPSYNHDIRVQCIRKIARITEYRYLCEMGKLKRVTRAFATYPKKIETEDEGSSCVGCRKSFGTGNFVAKIARKDCPHAFCFACETSFSLDWCPECKTAIVRVDDEELPRKKAASILQKSLSEFGKNPVLPWYLRVTYWGDAAYYAVKHNLITRKDHANIVPLTLVPGTTSFVDVLCFMFLNIAGLVPTEKGRFYCNPRDI